MANRRQRSLVSRALSRSASIAFQQAYRQVRVDPELAEALKARAKKEHRSVSEIARTALREYLEHVA